jgi:hypothetical protein
VKYISTPSLSISRVCARSLSLGRLMYDIETLKLSLELQLALQRDEYKELILTLQYSSLSIQ